MAKSAARSIVGARGARPAAAPRESGDTAFPMTVYKRCPASDRWPNGYEAKQIADAEAASKLDPSVWKASPSDLA